MKKKNIRNILGLLILLILSVWIIARHQSVVNAPYQKSTGFIFGTIYSLSYQYHEDIHEEIEQELKRIDASLSMFNDTSIISRINRGEDIVADTLLKKVFLRSMEISRETEGAFDITCAPLVNAWGFGFKKGIFPDSLQVDSLLQFVGYQKIDLTPEGRVKKQDPRTMFDCSAVAKGYAVDVIASLLQRHGIHNYMVEIGGEIDVKGINDKGHKWRIGIRKPVDDSLSVNQEMEKVLSITDAGIATSGNYRNYYYRDGKKYAHTVDPRTGYPVQHSIVSSTVICQDCMSADAYATSFMVMGFEKARQFVESHEGLEACFIYNDSVDQQQVYYSPGIQQYFSEQQQ